METEAKLDEIIARLARIETHLGILSTPPAIAPLPSKVSEKKPTKSMLEFKRMIEFANRMDQKLFFSAIRKQAADLMAIRKIDPNCCLSFKPQMLKKIDEKIHKTGAQFYIETFVSRVKCSHTPLKRKARKSCNELLIGFKPVPEIT